MECAANAAYEAYRARGVAADGRPLGRRPKPYELNDSKQVRQLGAILENAQAVKVLDEEGWAAAASVLIREDPALGSDLYDAVKRATEKLNKAPLDEIHDLSDNKQKLLMLRGLHRAIEDLATQADVSL